MLEHVLAAGGEATTDDARQTLLPEDAATPAEELLARRLLVPRGTGSVVVPGEVGLALRGGHTTVERVDDVPVLASTERSERQVDAAAAGAAFEAVRRLELLLDLWGAEPPSALRSGGLGVRDLKATAAALHVDEATMALLVETATAAGLLATAADVSATRCGCRPTWSTPGCCCRPRSGGPGWPAPGWTARGCRGWSGPATPPASRGTRWRPSWPAATWPRPAR